MTKPRLTRTDWILAALRALSASGPQALRIEPLARSLNSTKGSFYWHFEGPSALRDAILTFWEGAAVNDIISALAPLSPGAARLRGLADLLDMSLAPGHGGPQAEPALRDWGRFDPVVAACVARVDAKRIDYVADCLRDAELPTHPHARLLYAANLGLELLATDGTAGISEGVNTLLDSYGVPR